MHSPRNVTRRAFLSASAAAIGASWLPTGVGASVLRASLPQRPRPSTSQLLWQQDELAMFLHFGVNTFTDREWGDGSEDPRIFAPARLDASGG